MATSPNVTILRQGFAHQQPVTLQNFKTIPDAPVPEIQDGQILVRTLYLSIDPVLKFSFSQYPGAPQEAPMASSGLAEVVASKHPDYQVGDVIKGRGFGWSTYAVQSNPVGLQKLPRDSKFPLSQYLTGLGASALTAWSSIKHRGDFKAGQVIYISSAAGFVGQVVAQLAKRAGLKVIGSAGSDDKVAYLQKELGLDYAFNYKTQDMRAELDKACAKLGCPNGFDIYYDNVQGETLDIAIEKIKRHGRIIAVGMMSMQGTSGPSHTQYVYKNLGNVISKHLDILGFTLIDHFDDAPEFVSAFGPLVQNGEIKIQETIIDGLDKAPQALVGLLDGYYSGKVIVHVADL